MGLLDGLACFNCIFDLPVSFICLFFYERLSLGSQTDKVAMNPDGTAEVKRGIKTDICANSFPAQHRDVM